MSKSQIINLEPLCLLQRNIRKNKTFIDKSNIEINFYRNYLLSMLNNLTHLNNVRLFEDTEISYMDILSKLTSIKEELNFFKNPITFKTLKSHSTKVLSSKLKKIKNEFQMKGHIIAPDNINHILELHTYPESILDFTNSELDIIGFINNFFRPICLWDSIEHENIEEYYKKEEEKKEKKKNITKIQIEDKEDKENNEDKENKDEKENEKEENKEEENEEKDSDDEDKPSGPKIIMMGSIANLPSFLKNMLGGGNMKEPKIKRDVIYDYNDCYKILDNKNIEITKNNKGVSLLEDKIGGTIYIRVKTKIIAIQGLFKDDLLNISESNKIIKDKIEGHKSTLSFEIVSVPQYFKDNYFRTLNLRDILTLSSQELSTNINKKYNDYKSLQSKPLMTLVNEFMMSSKYRKIDILTVLLMSNEDDQKMACVLFDIFKSKDKKNIAEEIYLSLHFSVRSKLELVKKKLNEDNERLTKLTESDIPYEKRIQLMNVSDEIKARAIEKLKSMKTSLQGDSKAQNWLDGLLKIPFGVYKENDVISFKNNFIKKIKDTYNETVYSDYQIEKYLKSINDENNLLTEWNNYKVNKKNYLRTVRKTLDETVYGHKEAKTQLERIFAQWINGETKGAILGLQGPPGTGKTSLAKNGLSKCLIDKDGKPRPFAFLPIGGSVNGSTLVGHNFTYVGSSWGRIADVLMSTGCMNPIIFIDELDKISNTEHGREIISVLTHLTDLTQNDEFEDKYFQGIKLDLSKALIVFSFNDASLIDPILKDRITIIETHALKLAEKLTIIKDYMLPEIFKDVGFTNNEIIFSEELIKYLIETYTNEAGVRKIKEKLVEIVRDINLQRFHDDTIELPFVITKDYVKRLFENKPKVRVKKIASEPQVGLVNGLYATSSGLGGITIIQTIKYPSSKMLDLHITGKAGEVMKESVEYSLKNAYQLLSKEEQDKIIEDSNNKKNFGIHIHFPDGATPKDGPSAGLAITLAFYSLLTGKKVNNKVCMTGEIDLHGQASIIGGLESKLYGGKKAGCEIALIPNDNMEDLEIMRNENVSPEDETFKVIAVNNIHDVIKYSIVE